MPSFDETRVIAQIPREALRPFVRRFLVVESITERRDTHLPETGFVAAFCFRGDCRLKGDVRAPQAAITGLWSTMREHIHSRDHAVVVTTFTPTGAAALLRQPLEEFGHQTVDLNDLLGRRIAMDRFYDVLNRAANPAERIRAVEDLLLAGIDGSEPDPLVTAAVKLIEQTRAMMRIDELVRRIGLSQSALERRFRRIVGVSPRKFASLVRLRNVVRLRERGVDLTTIAHEAGYSDQPHFIKDFRRFTGQAPGSFFAR